MTYLQNKLHSGICLSEFSNCMVAKIKFEVETEARRVFFFQNRLIVTWLYHSPKHNKNSRKNDHCIKFLATEILYKLLAWMNLHYQQAHSQLPVYFC